MMKLTTLAACCLAVTGAVSLGAQSSKTTTETKIEIKDGKDVKVIGCVEKGGSPGSYVLTHVADKSGDLHSYMLVTDGEDFAKVLGHRVQIEGKAADREHGKVEIKSETKVDGPAKDTHSKSEFSGPYLGVKNMKSLASSCS